MSAEVLAGLRRLSDPLLALLLFAVDPGGLGGIALRGRPGPLRDRWLAVLRGALGPGVPLRRLPLHAGDDRLFGGLDLAATLATGRPMLERGLLADSDGGVLLLAMAERVTPAMAARLGQTIDTGEVKIERDGMARSLPARLGLVALDEGLDDDEAPPLALRDRLAFWADLDAFDPRAEDLDVLGAVPEARRRLGAATIEAGSIVRLCETGLALGVGSLRAQQLATRAAKAAAALAGRAETGDEAAALAARLVLAPRATRLPTEASPPPPPAEEPRAEAPPNDGDGAERADRADAPDDLVLAAAKAAIPPDLLRRLAQGLDPRRRASAGRTGPAAASPTRGRPAGVRAGMPAGGARLALIETLRAAAPWQTIRARASEPGRSRLEIRRDDLRVRRRKQRTGAVTIFVVDASGSLAANRLAEAKGAVELMLAECYIRRDEVALLAFRGRGVELMLPPTRSLTRAKRCLAAMPGGGATPLAAAIEAASELATALRRRARNPLLVFLTDGRANVGRDGLAGRSAADEDARQAARAFNATGLRGLVVDAAPRPRPAAEALAAEMGLRYVPLPRSDATALSRAVAAAAR